ncbi:MAG: 30S ribosomal protein S5 [Dehalococcoidia bacterium]|nr:30S ribosomal protein S5 [Dehalococcoidia bacterium]
MTNRYPNERRESERSQSGFSEKVVNLRRVAKVVKGGRHMSFSALVTVGDGHGRVGIGLGKSGAIPDAVRKATSAAQKNLITVPLAGTTIPHMVKAKYGAAEVLIKPATPGTGIIAGASMRAVLEPAGIKDVVTKSLGSQNPINVCRATLEALRQLRALPADRTVPQGGPAEQELREVVEVAVAATGGKG